MTKQNREVTISKMVSFESTEEAAEAELGGTAHTVRSMGGKGSAVAATSEGTVSVPISNKILGHPVG